MQNAFLRSSAFLEHARGNSVTRFFLVLYLLSAIRVGTQSTSQKSNWHLSVGIFHSSRSMTSQGMNKHPKPMTWHYKHYCSIAVGEAQT